MGNDKNECEALAGGRQWSSGLSENPTVQLGTYGPIRRICDVTYGDVHRDCKAEQTVYKKCFMEKIIL